MALELPKKEKFVTTIKGKQTNLFYLTNSNNFQCAVTNYGARVVAFLVHDKNRKLTDIVTGFSSIQDYLNADCPYYGATIGRFANRIAKGRFTLDGKEYKLEVNNGENSLHGGSTGFHSRVWDATQTEENSVSFTYISEDGEEGFPGKLTTTVIYKLTDENELVTNFELLADKKTIANITNHNFWNLNGEGNGTIYDHTLKIKASHFIATTSGSLPLGIKPVKNTHFDFLEFCKIGERINQDDIQLKNGNGYDHNYIFDKGLTSDAAIVAIVTGDVSGILMEVSTTEPGLQFYSGNFMQGKDIFKSGCSDDFRTAFCLETQHFPDSPNQPDFPSVVLEPFKKYVSKTVYKISTK